MRTVAVAALLSCLSAFAAAQKADAEALGRMLNRAANLRSHGDNDGAVRLARAVLDLDPDHAQTRAFLGFRRFDGQWRMPQEIDYLLQARAAKDSAAAPAAVAVAAPGAAPAPGSAAAVDRAARDLVRAFGPPRVALVRVPAIGLLDLRLQRSQITGVDTVTVGFGNGTGRLQLPRTECVSFGGAVAVPLGR